MNKLTYVTIGVFVAGIAVATGIGYYSYNQEKDVPPQETFEDLMESELKGLNLEKTTLPSASYVRVENQPPGLRVRVSSFALTKDAWIVIHEDKNGSPGAILGAGRFRANITSGDIELLRATEEGKTYYAMLHMDDGNTDFDPKSDLPLIDEKENAMMSVFMTKTLDVQTQ